MPPPHHTAPWPTTTQASCLACYRGRDDVVPELLLAAGWILAGDCGGRLYECLRTASCSDITRSLIPAVCVLAAADTTALDGAVTGKHRAQGKMANKSALLSVVAPSGEAGIARLIPASSSEAATLWGVMHQLCKKRTIGSQPSDWVGVSVNQPLEIPKVKHKSDTGDQRLRRRLEEQHFRAGCPPQPAIEIGHSSDTTKISIYFARNRQVVVLISRPSYWCTAILLPTRLPHAAPRAPVFPMADDTSWEASDIHEMDELPTSDQVLHAIHSAATSGGLGRVHWATRLTFATLLPMAVATRIAHHTASEHACFVVRVPQNAPKPPSKPPSKSRGR